MIPATVRILGREFTVEQNADLCLGEGNIGSCWAMKQRLVVDPNCTPDVQVAVLWHECLEAVNNMLELGLEHGTISRLETAIAQIVKENQSWW